MNNNGRVKPLMRMQAHARADNRDLRQKPDRIVRMPGCKIAQEPETKPRAHVG